MRKEETFGIKKTTTLYRRGFMISFQRSSPLEINFLIGIDSSHIAKMKNKTKNKGQVTIGLIIEPH